MVGKALSCNSVAFDDIILRGAMGSDENLNDAADPVGKRAGIDPVIDLEKIKSVAVVGHDPALARPPRRPDRDGGENG
eukprot:gene3746-2222_t